MLRNKKRIFQAIFLVQGLIVLGLFLARVSGPGANPAANAAEIVYKPSEISKSCPKSGLTEKLCPIHGTPALAEEPSHVPAQVGADNPASEAHKL